MTQREILIVEDDGIIAAHLELSLRRMGCAVAGVAASGEEALAMVALRRPGLVLMDIGLPGDMDGISAAARLREQHGISVVYLTAHTDDATLERAKATQPAGYLSKPFHEASLKATVTMVLHKGEAERALRESEERYRLTFDGAAMGIAHVGTDMRFRLANPRFCEILGYSAVELPSLSLADLVHPDDHELDRDLLRQLIAGERGSYSIEKRYRRKGGALIWGHVTVSLSRDARGVPEHFIGVLEDVTARREAEEKFRLLSAQALVGMAIFQDDRIIFANQACADITGHTVDEMLAMSIADIASMVHPDDVSFAQQMASQRANGAAATTRYNHRIVTKTGTLKWVERFSRMVPHGGRPAALLIFVDVTERKRAEAALAEKQRHYELLLQSSRDAVHVLDRSGKLREHNAAFLDHLGYTAEEASRLCVADWEAQWSGAELAARLGAVPFEAARFDTLHRRKDGSIREVELACAPFEEGGEVYLHASARDVTDRRRAERELQEARNALESLNRDLEERVALRTAEVILTSRARDDFLSVMSHELRTPLNGVLGITEALREGVYGPIEPRQETALGKLDAAAQHLLALITDILDVSKLDVGAVVLELASAKVEDLCWSSARVVQPSAARKHQSVKVHMDAGLTEMRVDARRVKQILVSLLGNAVKFTPEHGSIGLEATFADGERAVCFTVHDTGVGISPDDLPRLFQPFGQLDASLARRHGGIGLGLSRVQRLVELHGGRVEVESALDVGSRFSVVIPIGGPSPERA